MSTVQNILNQIAELPFAERQLLYNLLGATLQQPAAPAPTHRVAPIPEPDYSGAFQWLEEHAREYAGQWVALDGDRLIAHGPDHQEVFAAAKSDDAYLPLIELVEDPDAPPFAGF